ncbi:MAG: hypothetical protein WD939_06570 [Dehalococcoidia bacterium]
MSTGPDDQRQRIDQLSGSARRLLDYVAACGRGARYAVLRHLARVSEEDMVEDLRETVNAGVLAAAPGQPNVYDFTNDAVRELVLAEIGEQRLLKLRSRAEAARRRVLGEREMLP